MQGQYCPFACYFQNAFLIMANKTFCSEIYCVLSKDGTHGRRMACYLAAQTIFRNPHSSSFCMCTYKNSLLSLRPSISVCGVLVLCPLKRKVAVHTEHPHFLCAPNDGVTFGAYPPPGAAGFSGRFGCACLAVTRCPAPCASARHIRPRQPLSHLNILPALKDDKVK